MKYIVGGSFLLIIFAIGLAFSAHNELIVELNYFIAKGQFQLAHLLAAAFLLGVVLTLSFFLFFYVKSRLQNRYLKGRLRKLNSQQETLSKTKHQELDKVLDLSQKPSVKLLEQV